MIVPMAVLQPTIEGIIKVVIVDDSVEIQERLVARLREIPGMAIAGQAATVAETMSAGMQVDPSRAVV